jgi:hypothetical protein
LKLYYFQGKTASNFGDELNTWLWPQLLPNVFDDDPKALFLGIGSVLFDHFPQQQQKIVMGAGYGGYTAKPQIDEQWKIYFVRGRLTAQALGLDARLAIGDAAILLRSCAVPVVAKRYKVSFMPHWESVPRGNWVSICQRAGVNYIDPGQSVTTVLDQLLASELVITEAMHGAIVSDALRVPWIPVLPLRISHRMKWHDWASALGLTLDFERIVGPNAYEWTISRLESGRWRYRCDKYGSWLSYIDEPFASLTAAALKRLAGQRPYLSAEPAIASAHQQMLDKLEAFKADLRAPMLGVRERSMSRVSGIAADQLSPQT